MSRFRALPYAKALHQVVTGAHPQRAEEVIGELELIARVLSEVPDFHRVMVTPTVSVQTKTDILDQVLESLGVREPTRRFAHVVQQHYRLQHMEAIATTYRAMVDRACGRARATVEVAGPIADADRDRIVAAMANLVGSEVVADVVENSHLLAGFRVQVGSKIFDGSLLAQLDRLSRETFIE